jgi:hypothetical protein
MRTQAASRDSASHATKPFFGTRTAPAAAFFAPMVQAKKCAEEDPLLAGKQEVSLLQPKCAACSEGPRWQTKLSIGAPGDRFENEADQVADAVMRTPAAGSLQLQAARVEPGRIQRDAAESCAVKDEPKEEGEEEEETEDQHLDVDDDAAAAATPVSPKRDPGEVSPPPNMEAAIDSSRGGGAALQNETRDFMESRFGYDFSGVRVHTGATSQNLNRGVRSLAFTSGADIYFGSGQYRPETDSGKHLLAHELTHVVQQSGSAPGSVVREKSNGNSIALAREKKPYYGAGAFSGTAYHSLIEKMLRDHDKALVTEALIPGATRKDFKFNLVGVADLYKSTPAHTVSGVKAYKDADTEDLFLNMDGPEKRGTQPAVTSSPQLVGSDKAGWTWQGDFPSEIWLGEIKPFSHSKLIAGREQLYNYETGYAAFVRQAHKVNGGKTRQNLTTHRLKLDIPPYLDIDHWETQHATKGVPSISGPGNNSRLWIGSAGDGVYLYAPLPTEGGAAAPKAYFDQIAEMRAKVLTPLKTPPKKTAKMMKFISPGTRLAISAAGDGSSRRIQRSTSERGPAYWSKQAKDWEDARSKWGTKFRAYAKGAELKPHRAKVRFEKALGRAGRTLKAGEKVEVKNYKQSMFWSGRAGKLLGRVRFLLGGAWDKALAIFETNKEKMDKVRTKLKGMAEPKLKFSWASQLIAAVVAVCKVAFTAFITESFNFFADCFHSAMEKVMKDFEEEMNERFGEEICRYRKLFEDSKQKLEQEWGETIRLVTALVDAVQDVKYWMNIATLAVDLIRIGVQIVSCLTPPGLGCLWGLVAQLGIGAMVGIVVGTQWFNDTIVTPNVRDLLRKYIGPEYQKLINRALGPGLSKYHCDIVKPI